MYVAMRVKCERYSAGNLGFSLTGISLGINAVTSGFETLSTIATPTYSTSSYPYLGSYSSANLDGYIDTPVVVPMNIFSTAPSKEVMDSLYETYIEIKRGETASGQETIVSVSSDENTGAARTKIVTFASMVGGITRQLTVAQSAGAHPCITFSSTGENTIALTCNGTAAPTLYISRDKVNWTLWDYSSQAITSNSPLYMYGDNPSSFSSGESDYATFSISGSGSVSCSGNIMVLVDGDGTTKTIPRAYYFYRLFRGCSLLVSCPDLPATTLKDHCYSNMFYGSGVTAVPTLPASTCATYCYHNMFYNCTSLTNAGTLPATTLANYCYNAMFRGCTSLETAPNLGATTLKTNCYYNMFYGCTSLVNVQAKLPATTLQSSCYYGMFYQCSKLQTAPELPALTLTSYCYHQMFRYCSKLNYVKAMFTTTPGSSYTSNWLGSVASTGTFVKNSSATWTNRGSSAVPNNWTIQTA